MEQFGFVTTAPAHRRRGSLRWQQVQVIRVHLGDDQRHVVGHAVRARVADDDVAGLGEGVLVSGGGVGIERREEQQGRASGDRRLDAQVSRGFGPAPLEQPREGPRTAVPADRSLAASQARWNHGCASSRLYQLLPHHAGGPEHARPPIPAPP